MLMLSLIASRYLSQDIRFCVFAYALATELRLHLDVFGIVTLTRKSDHPHALNNSALNNPGVLLCYFDVDKKIAFLLLSYSSCYSGLTISSIDVLEMAMYINRCPSK